MTAALSVAVCKSTSVSRSHAPLFKPSYVRVGEKQVSTCCHCGSCNQQAPYGDGDGRRHGTSHAFGIPMVARRNVGRETIGSP